MFVIGKLLNEGHEAPTCLNLVTTYFDLPLPLLYCIQKSIYSLKFFKQGIKLVTALLLMTME
jgi:hypothetical protein